MNVTAVGNIGFDFAGYVPRAASFPALAQLNTSLDIIAPPSLDANFTSGPKTSTVAETESGTRGPNWIRLLFPPDRPDWDSILDSSEGTGQQTFKSFRQIPDASASADKYASDVPVTNTQIADRKATDTQLGETPDANTKARASARVTGAQLADSLLRSMLRTNTSNRAPEKKVSLPVAEKSGRFRQNQGKQLLNLAPAFAANLDTDRTATALPLMLSIPSATPVPIKSNAPGTLDIAFAPGWPSIEKQVREDSPPAPPAVQAAVQADVQPRLPASSVQPSDDAGANPVGASPRVLGSQVWAAPTETQAGTRNRSLPGPGEVAFKAQLVPRADTEIVATAGSSGSSGEEPRRSRGGMFRRAEDAGDLEFRSAFRQTLHDGAAASAGIETSAVTVPAMSPARPHVTAPPAAPNSSTPPSQTPEMTQPPLAGPPDSAPIRELTVRVAPPGKPPVEVRVLQQQGETHVVVRAAEQATRVTLRQDLPRLVAALDRAGFRAETFSPQAASELAPGAASGESPRQDAADSGSRDFPGAPGGQEREQRQQHQQRHRYDSWLEQMEE